MRKQIQEKYKKELPNLLDLLYINRKELRELKRVEYEYEKRIKIIRKKLATRIGYLQKDILKPREWKVLECRFGLVTGKSMTYEEVAKEFDVTRERIRQVESRAYEKLDII